MSFSFSEKGATKEGIVNALEALAPGQLGQDPMGTDVRDLLVKYIQRSDEPPSGFQFEVQAYGHAGSVEYNSLSTLSATIAVNPIPQQAQPSAPAVEAPPEEIGTT
jgi:hypothetical protein